MARMAWSTPESRQMKLSFFLLVLLLSGALGAEPLPIRFPDGVKASPEDILVSVSRAQGRIDRFAQEHGWEKLSRPLSYDSVEIYSSADKLADRIREMYDLGPDVKLPGPPVAGLGKRVLLSVTSQSFQKLRPTQTEPMVLEKLLAHEIGHRLHVAILDGNEEAMGPRWFYEGFAVVAAGQMDRGLAQPEEARRYMDSNDYESYGKLLRLCLTKWDLPTLVRRAGEPGFEEWVLEGLKSLPE